MNFGEIVAFVTQNPDQVAFYASAFVGGCALIAKGIEMLTGITASKKDDVYAGKLVRGVAWLKAILDKLGLEPKQ